MSLSPSKYGRTRLFVSQEFVEGGLVHFSSKQSHYLSAVMRKQLGDIIILFNGSQGEWEASIETISKREVIAKLTHVIKPQRNEPDCWVVFAPPRKGRLDTVIEKVTELGASNIVPVITRRTIVDRVNSSKCHLQSIEAAQQCERLSVPDIQEIQPLKTLLDSWPEGRLLFVCDETGEGDQPGEILPECKGQPAAILVGPEGGFTPDELEMLDKLSFVKKISLGPRILRVDTAVITALICWLNYCGDWRLKPSFSANS